MKEQALVEVVTWFRESTGEWIGQINYQTSDTNGTASYTGSAENEARNAAFAALGYLLLENYI